MQLSYYFFGYLLEEFQEIKYFYFKVGMIYFLKKMLGNKISFKLFLKLLFRKEILFIQKIFSEII